MNNMNNTTTTYRVFEPNLPRLRADIEKLNKRGAKLGAVPITITPTGNVEEVPVLNYNVRDSNGQPTVQRVNRFVFVDVAGESPKFAGWELAACVEHAEEGNILRKSPTCKVELNSFRTGAPRCDHCNTIRNRRSTYILIHDSGTQKLVGSNCIKNFLGHEDPQLLARCAELVWSLNELCTWAEEDEGFETGGSSHPRLHVDTFLAYAACAIRRLGFVSSKRAQETNAAGGNTQSTACTARCWLQPGPKCVEGVDYFKPEAVDFTAGIAAKQHVLDTFSPKDAETLSDFEHNLFTVCKCDSVEFTNTGLLAFVPEYYARSIESAKVAATQNYFGEVGKRYRGIEVSYLKSTGWDSAYGWTYLHTFATADGAKLLWKSGSNVDGCAGQKLSATFTVKSHEEYKGHKQTKISRAVLSSLETPAQSTQTSASSRNEGSCAAPNPAAPE